jgi:hypothetical protein
VIENPNNFRITDTPRRASLYYSNQTEKIPPGMPKRERRMRFRVTFFGILGMVIVYAVVTFWVFVVEPTIANVSNQWHAGDGKVTSLVYDFHHGGESTLIGMDYHGQITIIELVGEKATMYRGANFIGSDRLSHVVSLSVQDVNDDGLPDLVISVAGMQGETVLFNTGRAFSWTSK